MTTYLIHNQSGDAVSIGTVLADPMPDGLTVVELDESDAGLLAEGRGIWDSETLRVVLKPEHLWPDYNAEPDEGLS